MRRVRIPKFSVMRPTITDEVFSASGGQKSIKLKSAADFSTLEQAFELASWLTRQGLWCLVHDHLDNKDYYSGDFMKGAK